ncbi:DNA cytosine methyltransferase [soil metagenome]
MGFPIRCIDLFAGAGGFSLGVEQAGVQVEHAIEIDEWACETLRVNHRQCRVTNSDIRLLEDDWWRSEVQRHPDLLIGGPPCQGFSRAGPVNKDPKEPRNSLFREFVRVASILEPRLVILENVPGILRAKTENKESVASIIEDELRTLGYSTIRYVLNAERFGVPQLRRRVFFVGTMEGHLPEEISPTHRGESEQPVLFGDPLCDPLTVRDAISDLPLVDVGHFDKRVKYVGSPTNKFQREMRKGAGEWIENHVPMHHSPRTIERMNAIKPGQSQSHVKEEHAPRRRVRSETAGVGTYDQNNRRMYFDRPCHTLAASFYANFVHPELNRNFTPREGARIQTFPDR